MRFTASSRGTWNISIVGTETKNIFMRRATLHHRTVCHAVISAIIFSILKLLFTNSELCSTWKHNKGYRQQSKEAHTTPTPRCQVWHFARINLQRQQLQVRWNKAQDHIPLYHLQLPGVLFNRQKTTTTTVTSTLKESPGHHTTTSYSCQVWYFTGIIAQQQQLQVHRSGSRKTPNGGGWDQKR